MSESSDRRPLFKRLHTHHHFMWSYVRALTVALTRPVFIFLVFLTASILLGSSVVVYLLGRSHFGINSYTDALYFVVTTMTGVGYGDVVPLSSLGKYISMAFMLLGTAIFACFTATLATLIMELEALFSAREESKRR